MTLYFVFYDTGTHIATAEIEAGSAKEALGIACQVEPHDDIFDNEPIPAEWRAYLKDGTDLLFTPHPAVSEIRYISVSSYKDDNDCAEWGRKQTR